MLQCEPRDLLARGEEDGISANDQRFCPLPGQFCESLFQRVAQRVLVLGGRREARLPDGIHRLVGLLDSAARSLFHAAEYKAATLPA